MVNLNNKRTGDLLLLANGLVIVVLVNLLASFYFFRLDLTEEKRYSIKEPTRRMLHELDDVIHIEVFLEGNLNPGFRRLQKAIRETLEEFRIYSNNLIQYEFTNPSTAASQKARSEFMAALAEKGIQPTNVIDNRDGQVNEQIVFPGAVISFNGFETGVMLLKGNKGGGSDEVINQSIEGLEYELSTAIYKITNTQRKRIGYSVGHGELDSLQIASLNNSLLELYDVFRVNLKNKRSLSLYDALIIAKPRHAFSEAEKYKLDQYIMSGGKVLFLLDKVEASMDSASRDDYFAFAYELNLEDLLFKYGVRVNYDLIQDRVAGRYPVITGQVGGKPQMQLMEWPFFPLINQYADHPITRNLDAVATRFVSSVDTVKAIGIRKTPLAFSSAYSRTVTAPINVSINNLRRTVRAEDFSRRNIPFAYLLEGKFSSLYRNRFLPDGVEEERKLDEGESKIIVIADGDVARNEINPRNGQPQTLGFDPFTQYTFANQDFVMNAVAYLVEGEGLINARNKEIKLRPLDKNKVRDERVYWQVVNLTAPMIALIAFGVIRGVWRKRKFVRREV